MRAAVLMIFGVLMLSLMTLGTLIFYPFSPFGIADLKTVPDAVCPLENVTAQADVTVEGGWDLSELTIVSTWEPIKENSGLPVGGGIATIPDPSPVLEETSKSPVTRVAPQTPGEYRLSSTAEMVGTFGENSVFHGWPKIQKVEYEAINTLWVLPVDDKKCEGEA